jgi:bacillolysin
MPARSRRLVCVLFLAAGPLALAAGHEQRVAATEGEGLVNWAARLQQMSDAGQLRLARTREDTLLPGRRHQRFSQLESGVPVWGGELVVQTGPDGVLSVLGTLYEQIGLDTRPALSSAEALAVAKRAGSEPFGREGQPELVVLPREDGSYTLTYRIRTRRTGTLDLHLLFLDAHTGAVVKDLRDVKTQSAVGSGTGVLGDRKKLSTRSSGSQFVAEDGLRPPAIATFDYHGDFDRLAFDFPDFPQGSFAVDADNTWTDGANVDAHSYAGYTYDFYFKRFGRRGLDNSDIPIRSITHPASRKDFFTYSDDFIFQFFLNAGYYGDGIMIYGDGLPEGFTFGGQRWDYLAGSLDIVAHELTHGVTDYTSHLVYQGESGALNEAFSDMMGTSAEFFFQPAGSGPLKGDYLIGEDTITPGGIRSMANPHAFGDPDHYSVRYTGSADNGGVHTNSGIPNHVFFLAIEGGTNRTSGQHVTGVGGANREEIEKVFFRAFTQMLPSTANFATARAATLQSARDLYGAGGAVENAVRQAWSAVGVN